MATVIYNGFEWDDDKNRKNLAKHSISFEQAVLLFDGLYYRKTFLHDESGEERVMAVGKLFGKHATAIYTLRGIRKRLISVRRAKENEREKYRDLFNDA